MATNSASPDTEVDLKSKGSTNESLDAKQSQEVATPQSTSETATISTQGEGKIVREPHDSSESEEVHEVESCEEEEEEETKQSTKKKSGNPKGRKGGRKDTTLFDPKGYGWKRNSPKLDKDKKPTGDIYVACTGKCADGKTCFARGTLRKDGTWVTEGAKHKCVYKPNKGRKRDHEFNRRLQNLAVNDSGLPKDWWNIAAKEYPNSASRNPYNEAMARKLERWRDKQYEIFKTIKIDNISDYANMLEQNKHVLPYYIRYDDGSVKKRELSYHVITVDKRQHLLMYDAEFVHKVRDTLKFYMDATFSICPRIPGVKQFLTIMVQKYRSALPAFYAFMTRRKCEDYTAILKFIQQQFPDIKPRRAMSDYEKGMRKAMRLVFSQILVSGCYFHYCQALYRQARKKGAAVKKNKQDNEANHKILKRFMALAFLPPDKIQTAFDFLVAECKQVKPEGYWDKFIAYFRKEWMETVTPEFFSVHGLDYATNNFLESLHRILTREIGKRPRHYKFLRKLKDLCMFSWIQLETLELGMEPKLDSGPDVAKAKLKLARYQDQLAREEINENEFVTWCSNIYDDILIGRSCHDNPAASDDDDDTDRESEKDESEKDDSHLKNEEVDGQEGIQNSTVSNTQPALELPTNNGENSIENSIQPAIDLVIENIQMCQTESASVENVQHPVCSQSIDVQGLEYVARENAKTVESSTPKAQTNGKRKNVAVHENSLEEMKVLILSEHGYARSADGKKRSTSKNKSVQNKSRARRSN